MINLLPNSRKVEVKSARANVLLLRYIIMSVIAIVALLAVMYSSFFILSRTKQSAEELIQTNNTEAGVYSETKNQVKDLSDQLSGAKAVLDKEVVMSDILVQIGSLMPEGTVLDELSLDATKLSTPFELTAYGKSNDELLTLQSSFNGSQLFSNVTQLSIESSGGSTDYPAVIKLNVTLSTTWSRN